MSEKMKLGDEYREEKNQLLDDGDRTTWFRFEKRRKAIIWKILQLKILKRLILRLIGD